MKLTHEQWLERRRSGIGGSDMAAVLGVSPWKTPLNVWLDKTGRAPEVPPTVRMEIGTALEPLAAAKYEADTGRRVRRCNVLLRGADESGEPDIRIGNVDRLCMCADGSVPWTRKAGVRTERALEIKTSSDLQEWGEVPDHYVAQAQHYMGLMPTVKVFDFPVLFIARGTFRIYTVERDDELIANMAAAARNFWEKYVVPDTPPPPVNDEDVRASYPRSEPGKVAIATEQIERLVRDLRVNALKTKDLEAEAEALRVAIQKAMGDADTLSLPDGTKLATWKTSKDTSRTDWEKVARTLGRTEEPAFVDRIIAENTTTRPGSRPFKLATAK